MEENTNSIPKQIAMHACIHNIKNISSTKTERERERERAICLIIPFLSFLFPFSFFLHSPRLPRHPWRHVSGLHHVTPGATSAGSTTWRGVPPTWTSRDRPHDPPDTPTPRVTSSRPHAPRGEVRRCHVSNQFNFLSLSLSLQSLPKSNLRRDRDFLFFI